MLLSSPYKAQLFWDINCILTAVSFLYSQELFWSAWGILLVVIYYYHYSDDFFLSLSDFFDSLSFAPSMQPVTNELFKATLLLWCFLASLFLTVLSLSLLLWHGRWEFLWHTKRKRKGGVCLLPPPSRFCSIIIIIWCSIRIAHKLQHLHKPYIYLESYVVINLTASCSVVWPNYCLNGKM